MRIALCALLAGCSLTTMQRPQDVTAWSPPSKCDESYAAPFVDGALATAAIVATAIYAHDTDEPPDPCGPHPDTNCDVLPLPSGRHALIGSGAIVTLTYLVS